ncbi:origin recognition complex, subunit 2 [Gloeopeniophorella convolvens]|nr:origin recognition complex, subunit 2 [Gloeopeniophorella convolvens]
MSSYSSFNPSSDQDSEFYSEPDASPIKPTPRRPSAAAAAAAADDTDAPGGALGAPTAFDAYFLHASQPARTSANVFSQLVPPLSADEYAASLARTFYPPPLADAPARLLAAHAAHIPRYARELAAGFNLLFHGLGSKRAPLAALARACARSAHVLVLNAHLPAFAPRDVLAALARLPGAPQGAPGLARWLAARPARRLVLVVHSIDAAPRARALFGALAALPRVALAASVDRLAAPLLLWTSAELLARRWLWHDLTTLAPYDAELAGADPASLRAAARVGAGAGGAADGAGAGAAGAGGQMTETAAQHVLAAVTQRARKLFVLMGRRQLAALADTVAPAPAPAPARAGDAVAGQAAIAYDLLFNLARDNFVATSDTALRALLGEFRDHGLVATVSTGAMGAGETLWIPLHKERLARLLEGLQQDAAP